MQKGSEYYEIYEVCRKLVLVAGLVTFPEQWRAPLAVLVCVLSQCVLNLFWPYRNRFINSKCRRGPLSPSS